MSWPAQQAPDAPGRGAVVIELQRDADDLVAGCLQQGGCDGGIDAAGHGDDDPSPRAAGGVEAGRHELHVVLTFFLTGIRCAGRPSRAARGRCAAVIARRRVTGNLAWRVQSSTASGRVDGLGATNI